MPKQLVSGRLVNVPAGSAGMRTAVATTPHGTFTKKKTAHNYVAVVVWRRPAETIPAATHKSAIAGAPPYHVPEKTYPEAIWETWHREGSKIPTSNRGAQRLGVYPVVMK